MQCMVWEEKSLELLGRLRVQGRARVVHARCTSSYLVRMNLAHHLNTVGTFSKVTC